MSVAVAQGLPATWPGRATSEGHSSHPLSLDLAAWVALAANV